MFPFRNSRIYHFHFNSVSSNHLCGSRLQRWQLEADASTLPTFPHFFALITDLLHTHPSDYHPRQSTLSLTLLLLGESRFSPQLAPFSETLRLATSYPLTYYLSFSKRKVIRVLPNSNTLSKKKKKTTRHTVLEDGFRQINQIGQNGRHLRQRHSHNLKRIIHCLFDSGSAKKGNKSSNGEEEEEEDSKRISSKLEVSHCRQDLLLIWRAQPHTGGKGRARALSVAVIASPSRRDGSCPQGHLDGRVKKGKVSFSINYHTATTGATNVAVQQTLPVAGQNHTFSVRSSALGRARSWMSKADIALVSLSLSPL